MKSKFSFHFFAIITIFGWALAYVYTRLALQHFSPGALGFLRFFIASILLIIVFLMKKMKLPKISDIPWFIASAVTGFYIYMILFNEGAKYADAATISITLAINPILTAVMASHVFQEKISPIQWVAVGIQFAGIFVLSLSGGSVTVNQGVLLLLGAAVMFSIYNLIQRKLTRKYDPFQVTAISIFLATMMLSISAPTGFRELSNAPTNQLFNLFVLGVISSAIAHVTWSVAIQKAGKTSAVSNYLFFTPVVTAMTGFLIAGEIPGKATVIGGVIITLGGLLFNYADQDPHH